MWKNPVVMQHVLAQMREDGAVEDGAGPDDEVVVVDEGIEVEVSDVDSVLLVKTIAVVDVCVVEVDMSDVVDEVDA